MAKATDEAAVKTEKGQVRPIPASKRTASRLKFWKDIQDIATVQIDALVVLLIAAVVLVPLLWWWAGDLALLAGYIAIFAAAAFILLYAALVFIDRHVAAIDAQVSTAEKR
jgi:ABC-type bacteriocin/lantibiotic exporter with double-glycine peptidase domain